DAARLLTSPLAKLATRRRLEPLAHGASSLGDLPGVAAEGVAVLPDHPDPAPVVDGQDPDRAALEVDDPVDPGLPVGTDDPVLADPDPRVLVDRPRAERGPRVRLVGRLRHGS